MTSGVGLPLCLRRRPRFLAAAVEVMGLAMFVAQQALSLLVVAFVTSTASSGIAAAMPPCYRRAIVAAGLPSSSGIAEIARTIGTFQTVETGLVVSQKEEVRPSTVVASRNLYFRPSVKGHSLAGVPLDYRKMSPSEQFLKAFLQGCEHYDCFPRQASGLALCPLSCS